ncbi:hypothetical protein Q3G72_022852 [Acer saccharum]|nr:hypothetical protein Q3G72_022852 [Acer saccharum]
MLWNIWEGFVFWSILKPLKGLGCFETLLRLRVFFSREDLALADSILLEADYLARTGCLPGLDSAMVRVAQSWTEFLLELGLTLLRIESLAGLVFPGTGSIVGLVPFGTESLMDRVPPGIGPLADRVCLGEENTSLGRLPTFFG